MADKQYRLAVVYPTGAGDRGTAQLDRSRFSRIAETIRALGVDVEGAPYCDEVVEAVRAQLLGVDGVLVWVNPIEAGRDRSVLNAMLSDVAATGVFVSAHPDVIHLVGTKEILYHTRKMPWGCDTQLYRTAQAMRAQFPANLTSGGPRVLKQMRGQSGNGVWRVALAQPVVAGPSAASMDAIVCVRHAARGSVEEAMSLAQFLARCEPYFGHGGVIDQAYQVRLPDGMVRCYMVGARVAGFGEQLVNALCQASAGTPASQAPQPGPRLYYSPTRPDFQALKDKLERDWLPELCATVGLQADRLPLLWDADFLYGPKDCKGADTYVLCEINVSSVYPFPDDALVPLAAETLARLKRAR